MRLPNPLNILPEAEGSRTYNRITVEGEQVRTTQDGELLSGPSYGVLSEEERGDIRYFSQTLDANGVPSFTEVSQTSYEKLPVDQQAPVRYFRILRGDGAQFPFDDAGNNLDSDGYNRLPPTAQGTVVGPGPLVRLRFKAPIFLNGTTLRMSVRNTRTGANLDAPWQFIEPGDANPMIESNTLSINMPVGTLPLAEFDIAPNPFTPNGDDINDAAEIQFSIFKITSVREARVRIYTLAGDRVWQTQHMVNSGHKSIRWDGVNENGDKVPPGLYICQVELNVDNDVGSVSRSRLISVAY